MDLPTPLPTRSPRIRPAVGLGLPHNRQPHRMEPPPPLLQRSYLQEKWQQRSFLVF